jgi:hypothetical protein
VSPYVRYAAHVQPGLVLAQCAYLKILNELYGWVEVQKRIRRTHSSPMVRNVNVLENLGPKRFVRSDILYISW